jgi:hypothetical protein
MHLNATGVQFEISRIPLTGVVARLGWIYRAENVFGSLISKRLILYNASGVLKMSPSSFLKCLMGCKLDN